MDDPSLQVTASNLEIESGGPLSGGSSGHDDGGLRNSSSAIIRNAAAGITETTPAIVSSVAPNFQGHGHIVANEPTTTVNSFLVTSLAAGQSGQPNLESENVVVVELHALNRTGDDDFHQELAMPVEAGTAQHEQPNPGGGQSVVVVGAHAAALHSTNDFQQEEHVASVQVEAAGQGEPNPGARGNIAVGLHALRNSSSTDDFQQEAAVPVPVPVPVEVAERVEPNPGGSENIAVRLHVANSTNAQQEVELALPVEVPDDDDHKRPHEEAAQQLEIRRSQERNSNEGVDESFVCPICMEPWTNSGEHRICSLACGHLFGKSCIKRWLRQAGRKVSRCPHCNKRAKLDDVRTLYVPRTLAVVDGDAQQLAQEVRALRAENLRLKSEKENLLQEVLQNKERNGLVQAPALSLAENSATIHLINVAEPPNITTGSEPVQNLGNEVTSRSHLFDLSFRQAFDSRSRAVIPSGRQDHLHSEVGSNVYGRVSEAGSYPSSSRAGGMDNCGGSFQLQNVVPVHGGKVFDMDAESLTVILSNKNQGSGSGFGLSKMSLLSSREIEKIEFPSGFGAIRDIRLSPSGIGGTGKCAVVASTGKKLSLVSLESNNIVLTYSVQSPPWSCAWDPNVPNLLYSGLQNGCLLLVDLRQTSSPIAMLNGPSNRPIHTLQVVRSQSSIQANMGSSQPLGGREILSASNSGILLWNLGSSVAGSEMASPQCVFSDRELVCISLVYECSVNTAVASFRRSPSAQTEPSWSSSHGASARQISNQPIDDLLNSRASPAAVGREEPSHWVFSRRQGSSRSQMKEMIRTAESRLPWERMQAMVGNKSQSLMTRSAIISPSKSTPRSKSLFACGDEGTNSVWLWDMKSCRLTDTLVSHPSRILDVKNVQIQGEDMLGCVSEGTFQIYRRVLGLGYGV